MGTQLFPAFMNHGGCFPYSFLLVIAPGFGIFLTHTHIILYQRPEKGPFCRSLELSLCVTSSSLVFFALKIPAALASLNSELCFFHSPICQASFGLLLLSPENSLQAVNKGSCQAQFVCFSSLRDQCPGLLVVHCLETIVYIFCPIL